MYKGVRAFTALGHVGTAAIVTIVRNITQPKNPQK
jgi:hypothetical protein